MQKVNFDCYGKMVMVYGREGIGKTYSVVTTAPQPILYCQFDRGLNKSIDRSVLKDMDLEAIQPDSSDPCQMAKFIRELENNMNDIGKRYEGGSIIIDSISHLSKRYVHEISLETDIDESPFQKVEMTWNDWDRVGALLMTVTKICRSFADNYNINCIFIALEDTVPDFNKTLLAAPAFDGMKYGKVFSSFFDDIGYVKENIIDDKRIFPPKIFFSHNNQVISRWSGDESRRPKLLDMSYLKEVNK